MHTTDIQTMPQGDFELGVGFLILEPYITNMLVAGRMSVITTNRDRPK
jgi:hypothetical protein